MSKSNINYKIKSYNFGLIAEYIAIILLIIKGYNILRHRYKNRFGEIDIIAKKLHKIVFIEVKARKNNNFIKESISTQQINRIKNSAEIFISQNQHYSNYYFRYDLIIFNKIFIAKHFKNFF